MTQKVAILSDIHANLAAFEAVLADVDQYGPDAIWVLGDTIGYGPDPRACLERATDVADVLLIGNHEKEAVEPTIYSEDVVLEMLRWCVGELEGCGAWDTLCEHMRAVGFRAAATHREPGRHLVHASARWPTEQYVWPAHQCQYLIYNDQIDQRLTEFMGEFKELHGFNGHTHTAAILTPYEHHEIFDPYHHSLDRHGTHTFVGPRAIFCVPVGPATIDGLAGRKVVINPGSVGQPRRLGDPRATYARYDGDRVEIRRVPYDVRRTQRKMARLPIDKRFRKDLIDRIKTG